MKKILVLLSMFALASGAWAEVDYPYKYNWTFNVGNVPYASEDVFPSDMEAYVIDKNVRSSDTVTGYKELFGITLDQAKAAHNVTGQTADKDFWKLAPAKNSGHAYFTYGEMSDGSEGYFASFAAAVESDENIEKKYNKGNSILADYSQDLALVIFSKEKGTYQVLNALGGGAVENLQFAAGFNPVPEPTSGLLLLLGVAGLALKRKKAA